jgi:hypothetical protein
MVKQSKETSSTATDGARLLGLGSDSWPRSRKESFWSGAIVVVGMDLPEEPVFDNRSYGQRLQADMS